MALFGRKTSTSGQEMQSGNSLIAHAPYPSQDMGRIFLIDFENVHDEGLDGYGDLNENDKVFFFYSIQIKNISFDRHVEMMNCKASVEYIKTGKTAKNYLDFQLTTYLGYLLGKGEQGKIYIISKDQGFDSTVDFWLERGYQITRQESIDGHLLSIKKKTVRAAKPVKTVKPAKPAKPEKTAKQEKPAKAEKIEKQEKPDKAEKSAKTGKVGNAGKITIAEGGNKLALQNATEKAAESGTPIMSEIAANPGTPITSEIAANPGMATMSEKVAKPTTPAKAMKQQKRPTPISQLTESSRKTIRNAIKGEELVASAYTTIYRYFLNSTSKQNFWQSLVKAFGQERGTSIYNSLKTIYSKYHNDEE